MSVTIVPPAAEHFDSWAATVAEFGGVHIDGAGLDLGAEPERETFSAFLEKAELYGRAGAELPEGHVACDYFWILEDGDVVGFIAFRRELNDWLRRVGGHIGYSLRPSRRRRGIVSAALRLVLDRARDEGYDRVMLTCDDDNPGSFRTIEGAGGVLEDVVDAADAGHPRLRRYWIPLG